MSDPKKTSAVPRPAATVVVVRPNAGASSEGEGGPRSNEIEVFLVKRHHKSGFMANAHVFPGGRVEPQDAAFARALPDAVRERAAALIDGEDDDVTAAAFAIASIRETAEECGVLLARRKTDGETATGPQADKIVRALREETPAPLQSLLDAEGLQLDLAGLVSLAWWLTPTAEPKRYDTRFFAAWAPAGQSAAPDLIETTAGDWMTPSAALAAYTAGDIVLAPPTLVTLEDLRGVSDLDELRRSVPRPIVCVCPRLVTDDAIGMVLALPGDPLHATEGESVQHRVEGWSRTRIIQNAEGKFISAAHE